MRTPDTFKIRALKLIEFKDVLGNVLKSIKPGDLMNASGLTETYFITSMGGIFFEEAEAVLE